MDEEECEDEVAQDDQEQDHQQLNDEDQESASGLIDDGHQEDDNQALEQEEFDAQEGKDLSLNTLNFVLFRFARTEKSIRFIIPTNGRQS